MKSFFTFVIVFVFLTTLPLESAEFYVSPNDKNNGTRNKEAPFRSLEAARDAIRSARQAGNIKSDEPVTVHVGEGNYFFQNSFELKSDDSGTNDAPVIYRAEKPFQTRLIGGVVVPQSSWKKVTDKEILKRLEPAVHDNVLVADLATLDIPAWKDWADQFRGCPNAPPELFFDDQPMTVARWPNEGWTSFKTTIDSGLPHDDKTAKSIQAVEQKSGIKFTHPETDTTKLHGGTFLYDEEGLKIRDQQRFAKWNTEEGVWLCGYWVHDWSEQVLKVSKIDTEQKILFLKGVHGYGIGGHSWSDYNERRYYVLNVLDALDVPGEWYLDRKNNRLYFYPPKNIAEASVTLSILQQPLIVLRDVKNVQFQGFTLGPTFGHGIVMQGGANNAILGCRIKNTGQGGVQMIGGTENRVQSCDLENLGSTGIVINGGDRKNLIPGNNEAVNNHIRRFGRWSRTYAGAVSVHGMGNSVRNNKMHEGPHLAVAYGGNENRIERNEIFDVLHETSDAGALYTGRDWTSQGNIIAENYIHDLGVPSVNGAMGVYIDDCDSGDTVERNIFVRAKRAVFLGGGRYNTVRSNLFVDCFQGIQLDSRGMSWKQWNTPGDGWNLEEKAEAFDYKNPPWSARYPQLAETMTNMPQAPIGNVFENNIMIDCKQWIFLDGKVLQLLEQSGVKDNIIVANNVVVENTVKSDDAKLPAKEQQLQQFVKDVPPEFRNPDKADYRFKEGSPLSNAAPQGFAIPFENIGLYIDEYRKAL